MICTAHQMLLGGQIKENELGGARSTYGGKKRILVRRTEGKRPLGRPCRAWKDNIKMEFVTGRTDLRETGNLCLK
jgi:hypothetical protein